MWIEMKMRAVRKSFLQRGHVIKGPEKVKERTLCISGKRRCQREEQQWGSFRGYSRRREWLKWGVTRGSQGIQDFARVWLYL